MRKTIGSFSLSAILIFMALISMNYSKETVDSPTKNARLIEGTELAAWQDLIDAAPDSFRIKRGLGYKQIGGGLAINFKSMPIPLFNRVIGLGLSEPLTPSVVDDIKAYYAHNEKYLIHFFKGMEPSDIEKSLKKQGFYLAGSWERVVRDAKALPETPKNDSIIVKQVDESLKEEWVKFLIDTYGFDFYEWPRSFALRKGWKHYVAYRQNKIVACRSFFITKDKTVFSGVDAPVPGVMTKDCGPDFAIWQKAISDRLQEGAVLFVADIELPDPHTNKDAYDGFTRLGFEIPYTRYHYRLNK